MPKVSVVMSVYNDEKFVGQSIQGVLNSTFKDFEFIICNDCSTDNTEEVIKSFKDERIVYVKNEINLKAAGGANRGLSLAKGEYVMRIDSDDITMPDRMQKQVDFLDSHPDVALVGGWAQAIDNEGNPVYQMTCPEKVEIKNIFKNKSFIQPSIMVRKSVFDELNGYRAIKITRRAEDFDLFCRIYQKGYRGENLQENVIYYREDYESYKKRKFRYRIDIYKLMIYWIKELKLPFKYRFYALKTLLVGLIPKKILYSIKKRSK